MGIVDGGWGTDERGEGLRLCITLSFRIGGGVLRARESDNVILFIQSAGKKEILVRMYQEHGPNSVHRCAYDGHTGSLQEARPKINVKLCGTSYSPLDEDDISETSRYVVRR